jgi:hypothetical protein
MHGHKRVVKKNGQVMSTTALVLISILIGIAILGIAALIFLRKRRTEGLRTRFGPEYARAVQESGDRRHAEASLEERKKRVERFKLQLLTPGDRARFTESWRRVQARFVDEPNGAITEADQLLGDVMSTRGYPVSDFEQRTADISVDHPRVVENYRAAHEIALRHAQGQASTEDLRQAMIHYRTLFVELVSEPEMASAKAAS